MPAPDGQGSVLPFTEVAYPDEDTPLLLLLVLADRHVAAALQQHLIAAGFHDHRLVHHTVMAHVTYDGIRLTELAARAGVTKQAMSELVTDLVKLGYLQTKPDPADRRAKLITFADRGRRAVDAATKAFGTMDKRLEARVTPQGLRRLRRSLVEVLGTSLQPSAGAASSAGAPTSRAPRKSPKVQ
jgi:DNA-binding MarR family transcriptional regulator